MFLQRVTQRAARVQLGQALASAALAPFYAVGALVGLLAAALRWLVAAVAEGWEATRREAGWLEVAVLLAIAVVVTTIWMV